MEAIAIMSKFIFQTMLSTFLVGFGCWNLWTGNNKEWAASTIGGIVGWWLEAPSVKKSESDRNNNE